MNRKNLANNLINASNADERKLLLKKNIDLSDAELARKLKEICYASWSNEPTIARKTASALKTLTKFNPDKEIKAICFWVSGIAQLTKGNLNKTIKNLNNSAVIFNKIDKKQESAHTQVAKLIPLALLGKYEEAIKCGEDSLNIFKKFDDELSAGKVEKNLGNIIVRQDGILKAEKYYISAMRRFIKIKDFEELAMCEVNLADNYVDLHNFHQAEKYYSQALKSAQEAKMTFVEAEIEASLGNLDMFRGRYSKALQHLEIARQKFEELNIPHRSIIAELEIANIYFEINLSDEAFAIYKSVTKKLNTFKMRGDEAKARANFGKVAIVKNEFSIARRELNKSAKLFVLENNKSGAADVKLSEANLEFLLGNFEKARKIINETNKLLKDSQNVRLKLQASFLQGEVLGNLKSYKESAKLLNATYRRSVKHEQLNLAQICLNSLGKLALQERKVRKAENYFKRSVKMIENLRAPLPAEEFRMAFLADKLAPFENLAKIYLRWNKIEKAFISIENARAKTLSESLQEISGPQIKPLTQNKSLSKKLGCLREELNWFYSHLNRAGDEEIEDLQAKIKKREKQIADVLRQIESIKTLKPDKEKILETSVRISLANLQKQIGKGKALIEFIRLEDTFSAFVITDEKIKYIYDLAKENEIVSLLEGLQFQFGALRYGANSLDKFADELKKRADFYLQKLYEKLIEPLADLIKNRSLVFVPASALHSVPFQALFDGKNYLIENHEIIYSPSATVWKILNEKPSRKLRNALLIGYADQNIPLVNSEVKAVKKSFDNAKTFVGKNATFSNYARNAEDFDILHLACHGQFRPDNPLFSSLHLADGFVTVRDICSQKLKAELVTLSACETGLNKIFAGNEILGLARGFLTAGANSIVLSLWTVNDAATRDLMKEFYAEIQGGKTVSESLRKVQIDFIKRKKHSYFWSPFVIIGR